MVSQRLRIYSKSSIFLLLIFIAGSAHGGILTETALFYRCYTHITGTRVKYYDPLLAEVKKGTRTAVSACLEVLNLAQLSNNASSVLVNSSNPLAKKILTHFHHLHYSWFSMKDFPVISAGGNAIDIQDLFDSSTPALYFTRALFKPLVPAKDVITTGEYLRAVRTTMAPTQGPESGHPVTDFIFSDSFSFAPKGELLGMESVPSAVVNFPTNPVDKPFRPAGTLDLNMTLGGGLLGTQPYLLLNIGALSSQQTFKSDGGMKMHRLWGRAVFKDLLCRDLPVVRVADVNDMVDPKSSIPFRTSNSCTKCHASHDRISGVIRGMKVLYVGDMDETAVGLKKRGGNFPTFHPVKMPAETSWAASPDPDYYQRPTNGRLYLRDYLGNLIDLPITSVPDLGLKLSDLDDFYICIAKRYYSFFTGIDVDNGDLGDPNHGISPNPAQMAHRNLVIKLGTNLKVHQSLKQLITDIIQLENYKQSDFGIGSGTNVK